MKNHDTRSKIDKNEGYWRSRLLIGTPTTGTVRIEWVMARYGQVIPTNWSVADALQWIPSHAPLNYLVADAQNLIVKSCIEQGFEWLFLVEQDNVLPADAFIRLNQYMISKKVPVVSGLYFTKSEPPEPMIYRKSGWGYYNNWKMGDQVWCSGVPTGTLLIHASILKAMWDESPEYNVGGVITRRVFQEPAEAWFDPEMGGYHTESGTSDLHWCKKIIEGNYFEKAGWKKYAKMKYPFLVDTNLFIKHIDMNGRQFPLSIPPQFIGAK